MSAPGPPRLGHLSAPATTKLRAGHALICGLRACPAVRAVPPGTLGSARMDLAARRQRSGEIRGNV